MRMSLLIFTLLARFVRPSLLVSQGPQTGSHLLAGTLQPAPAEKWRRYPPKIGLLIPA